uniref:Uncharacterized protein n=1 Tax=Oryza punctata TaxID=4537 RepID=A0A0E0LAC6_ORYPU
MTRNSFFSFRIQGEAFLRLLPARVSLSSSSPSPSPVAGGAQPAGVSLSLSAGGLLAVGFLLPASSSPARLHLQIGRLPSVVKPALDS